jgi:hypothetical protein
MISVQEIRRSGGQATRGLAHQNLDDEEFYRYKSGIDSFIKKTKRNESRMVGEC